jgi:glycosyltransferase involved in cell wall biosynthesis
MRIAYLSTFYPFRGGIAQFNANLYRAFESLGHDIKAFTFTRQYPNFLFPGDTQYVTKDDIADPIPADRILNTINPVSYLTASKKIKKFSPDIMLTKFWLPFFGPSLGKVLSGTKKRSKNISIIDNAIPHEKRPGDKLFSKYFFKQNHEFIAMSESVKNDIYKIKSDATVHHHPHPIYDHFPENINKTDARNKLGINPEDRILLFFGFIRDYKGLDILIESLKNLPSNYKLIIAGEIYGDFDKYDKLIDKLNLNDRIIKIIRYISDSEVSELFSASDVAMLTYKSATQSGILGIAYHYNLPVIATNTGGMKEMIEPYNTGIVIEYAVPELISEAIINYFNSNINFFDNIEKFKEIASWNHLAEFILKLK